MSALFQRDISIIIPVYNLENYIQPMLNSLKEQRLGGYTAEFIFVLNNCTDNSGRVIRESGLECTIVNCDIQGCGPARNKGIDLARGEYIWFMDGDDWLLSDTAIWDALDKAQGKDIIRIPFKSNRYMGQYFSMVWQYVFRHEFIHGIYFPDYQPAEDDAYMDTVLKMAGLDRYTYMSLPHTEPLYFYNYLREGSNMQRHYSGEKI